MKRVIPNFIGIPAQVGALLNPDPDIPAAAITFEGTEDYVFFEGQSAPDYIIFETT